MSATCSYQCHRAISLVLPRMIKIYTVLPFNLSCIKSNQHVLNFSKVGDGLLRFDTIFPQDKILDRPNHLLNLDCPLDVCSLGHSSGSVDTLAILENLVHCSDMSVKGANQRWWLPRSVHCCIVELDDDFDDKNVGFILLLSYGPIFVSQSRLCWSTICVTFWT